MADRIADTLTDQTAPVARPSGLPLEEKDWRSTPRGVQVVVVMLWERVQFLEREVATQREQLGQIELAEFATPALLLVLRPVIRREHPDERGSLRGDNLGDRRVTREPVGL